MKRAQAEVKKYASMIDMLISKNAYSVTWFAAENRTVRIVRRRYGKNKKFNKRVMEIQITDGPPNYAERKRIKSKKSNIGSLFVKGTTTDALKRMGYKSNTVSYSE